MKARQIPTSETSRDCIPRPRLRASGRSNSEQPIFKLRGGRRGSLQKYRPRIPNQSELNTDGDGKDGSGETNSKYSRHPASSPASEHTSSSRRHHPATNTDDAATASWASMPKKRQLALLAFARLCETAVNSSMQSYIFFQLRSFKLSDGSVPGHAALAFQVSVLNAVVAGPQLFTSILWGRLADSPHIGRKCVVLVSLFGTGVGSLGMGFANSFMAVAFWRFLVGLVNGNRGVMRTMVKEIGGDEFESRAVLLLPMALNVGTVVGPLLGGFLADPAASHPRPLQTEGFLRGSNAAQWLLKWPFALPNVFNGTCMIACAALLTFGLEETLKGARVRPGYILGKWAKNLFRQRSQPCYTALTEDAGLASRASRGKPGPCIRVWTPRLATTLLARGLMMMHIGAYPSLLLAFISTPRYDASSSFATGDQTDAMAKASLPVPPNYHPSAPFVFTGGLSFKPSGIALALSIRGIGGLVLQLLLFPALKNALGTIRLYRYSLLLFPLSYLLTPYLAVISSSTSPPLPAAGVLLWIAMALVLTIQTVARSFALPAAAMLLNAASPDPSALGTVNGIGQSVSAAAKAVGPLLAGWLYGVGLSYGLVGAAWWALAAVAVSAAVAGGWATAEEGVESVQGEKRKAQGSRKHW
ncbi:major facilitator superfamily protein [Hirsutella rhossiliensis]|uniref:Major facilitator superfamily domain-containing protein n=1 Tax=Hirsutella rhossiliensis TaxID=111463 RepID=A0A9P8N4J0_9HYPO|nr:major facilitator superfamily domain-containing protein [Hirsutella rhossiliensis]KAH0966812.1 major facilitator superfamily domain-containing protein [Hirsutella rhossiliensis]